MRRGTRHRASTTMRPMTRDTYLPERVADGFVWRRGDYCISTNPARLDLDFVAAQLATAYWAIGRSRVNIERSIHGSIAFGVYDGADQIGFARVVSDRATFAYVCDVIIAPTMRGLGLGTWLMACVGAHPELLAVGRWLLATHDAHGLYRKLGYSALPEPARWMQRIVEPPLPLEDPT
jgi:GNAT superfamily N-acetyltransferase